MLGTVALLTALSGCGDGATTELDERTPSVPGSAGADGGTADESEAPRLLDLEIRVAGSDEPIRGSVSEHGGTLRVSSYPTVFALPISYGPLPLSFDGAFGDDFCRSVQELVELDSPEAIELVRHRGAPPARIPLSSLVWPETMGEAQLSARALGVSSGVVFENPLIIEAIEISLELSSQALSQTLGTEDLSAVLDDALELQGAAARRTGVLPLALGAQDLWCDLAHGDATIRIQVSGHFGSEPYQGETVVSGAEAL